MTLTSVDDVQALARRGRADARAISWIAAAIGTYIVLNSLSIRTSIFARVGFALMLCVIGIVLFAGLLHRERGSTSEHSVHSVIAAWGTLMLLDLLAYPVSHADSFVGALTDGLVAMTPVFLYVALSLWAPSDRELVKMIVVIAVFALIAVVVAWRLSPSGQRFQAPSIISIVGPWVFAVFPVQTDILSSRAQRYIRLFASVSVVGILPLILLSRSRTALGVWAAVGIACLLWPGMRRAPRTAVLVVILLVVVGLGIALGPRLESSSTVPKILREARIAEIASGTFDVSNNARVLEVRDALETMRHDGGVLEDLLGLGNGSSYVPDHSYIVSNVDPDTGRVHNIHVTPIMIWFRYGLVGLAVFLAIIWSLVRNALANYWERRDVLSVLLLLLALMYLPDLMVRNSFVDPVFSLIVAAVLLTGRRKRAEPCA